jgi:hypothetical protein
MQPNTSKVETGLQTRILTNIQHEPDPIKNQWFAPTICPLKTRNKSYAWLRQPTTWRAAILNRAKIHFLNISSHLKPLALTYTMMWTFFKTIDQGCVCWSELSISLILISSFLIFTFSLLTHQINGMQCCWRRWSKLLVLVGYLF